MPDAGPESSTEPVDAATEGPAEPPEAGAGSAAGPAGATAEVGERAPAVDVHPPTRLEQGSYLALSGLFHGVAKLAFRLEIRGREHLPTSGPYVVAPVHRSNLDFILVSTIHSTRMRYMGKASIWKYPTLGRFFSMLGAFPSL